MQTQEFAALGEAQGYSGSVKRGQLWALMGISFFRPEKKSPNRWNLKSERVGYGRRELSINGGM